MDATDHKLLTVIQQAGRISIKQLAEQCYISASNASTRVQALEAAGIITKYVACVDCAKVGQFIKAFVRVAVNAKDKPEFYAYVTAHDHIIDCDCITGDYSMQLTVVFEAMTALDAFVNDLQQFGDTHTCVVFSTHASMRAIPLADEGEKGAS
jgi:Lrp/AsnC family leucine-responsive transcriptional regulator